MKFPLNDNELIQQISESRSDFAFDKEGVKRKLMSSIQQQKYSPLGRFERARAWVFKFNVGFSMAIIAVFAGVLGFAQAAKPGDKLHFLDKIEDNALLSLPMPDSLKAKVETSIASERVSELEKLPIIGPTQQPNENKLNAAEESQQILSNAVNTATELQKRSATKGDSKASAKAKKILDNLDKLANQQQTQLEAIKNQTTDSQIKQRIDRNLEAVKAMRQKVRSENEDEFEDKKIRSEDLSTDEVRQIENEQERNEIED